MTSGPLRSKFGIDGNSPAARGTSEPLRVAPGPSTLTSVRFGSFVLDRSNKRLLRDGCALHLTPKAFGVLDHLLRHAGELVSKDDLFHAVWPRVVVTEAALTVCIREIRKVLNDSSRRPRYVETIYKRGFRFIAQVQAVNSENFDTRTGLVGRAEAREKLNAGLAKMHAGQRQLIFITGEAGIGKTSLVEDFLGGCAHDAYWIGKGHCIEQHGGGEPYLPVLEAVGRLCKEDDQIIPGLLSQFAPSWLSHFPSVISTLIGSGGDPPEYASNTESRMREMADLLEAISATKPLLLCLEDLHWCDRSTTDFLSFLARRKDVARLLILVTLRPADTIIGNLPLRELKQDLLLRGLSSQIPVEYLSLADISHYLSTRFRPNVFPDDFAGFIQRLSDGNPLFMVNILVALQESGMLEQNTDGWCLGIQLEQLANYIPNNLQEMIANQVERLPSGLKLALEASSVAGEPGGVGVWLTVAEAAAALAVAPVKIEEDMDRLAKGGHFLRYLGTSECPGGEISGQYEFTHALYQKAVYERVGLTSRITWHRRIAEYLERSYGNRVVEIVHKLAVHFEFGREFIKSAGYLCQTAILASGIGGSREAVATLEKARHLLTKVAPTAKRNRMELTVLQLLGPALTAAQGNAAPEIENVYLRALELCLSLDEKTEQFPVLFGLRSFYMISGELHKAQELAQKLLILAESLNDSGLRLEAHVGFASVCFYQGDLAESHRHALAGIELYDPGRHSDHAPKYGLDPGVFCYARAGQTAWALGYPKRALDFAGRAVAIARKANHPYSLVFALHNQTLIYLYRRDGRLAIATAETAARLALQYGFAFLLAWGYYLTAWAHALNNDSVRAYQEIDKALAAPKPDACTTESFLKLFLAECFYYLADWRKGLALLQEPARVHAYDAERFRLLAEFYRLQQASECQPEQSITGGIGRIEQNYREALALSERQGAKAYSLRTALGCSTFLMQQGRYDEAYEILRKAHAEVPEGDETLDGQEAEQSLQMLAKYRSHHCTRIERV